MSDSDRLEFIRELLLSVPAGQFTSVLDNIQKLSQVDGDVLKEVEQRYQAQICAEGSSSSSESTHPLAETLKKEMEAYQTSGSNNNNDDDSSNDGGGVITRRVVLAKGQEDSQILMRTYAERVDEEQFRTGSWTAEWTIQSDYPGSNTAQLSGHVNTCVFSYEDGNVQIRSNKIFLQVSLESDNDLLAKIIVQQISEWETQVIQSLQESYSQVSKNLKAIRGILPITHTRLNWSVVTQRTVRNLQETVKK